MKYLFKREEINVHDSWSFSYVSIMDIK